MDNVGLTRKGLTGRSKTMKITAHLRWIVAGGIALLTLIFLFFLFFATKNFLDLWDRLEQLPAWLFYIYSLLILAVLLFSGWIIYKLVWGGRPPTVADANRNEPVTRESLAQEIAQIESAGMDASELRKELEKLEKRREAGQVNVAFFGDVSTGKSSLIKALLPEAGVEISLRGGSTREVEEYSWQTPAGDRVLLTDLPGRNEVEGTLDDDARDEAIRAQIVVYVTDADLSRTQYQDIMELAEFGKPMVLVVNKADQYNTDERHQIEERIRSRFNDRSPPPIVFTQSGGMEDILRVYPDGREETIQRPRKPETKALTEYLQAEIDQHLEDLSNLRDVSVYHLVQEKLDETRAAFRRKEAERVVRNSTGKAILGALASVSPGTDLVIQGVIGTRMVQDLCKLYDSPVRQLDIDQFLNFSQDRMKKSIPLILAVAGNGLKAFPGIGTVAGGMVHAVAYGMIFDALGHAVAQTLEQRGSLKAAAAAETFQEILSGNLEERTKTFARLVAEQYRNK